MTDITVWPCPHCGVNLAVVGRDVDEKRVERCGACRGIVPWDSPALPQSGG